MNEAEYLMKNYGHRGGCYNTLAYQRLAYLTWSSTKISSWAEKPLRCLGLRVRQVLEILLERTYSYPTGGHFACACVNLLNDNSVGASNLMAGNRKLKRKVTVLLKAISLVLWIPYFPTKIFSMTKIGRFLRGFSLVDFSAVAFLGLLKTFNTQRQKVMFLYKSDFHWQSNAFLWFDFQTRAFTYQGGNAS